MRHKHLRCTGSTRLYWNNENCLKATSSSEQLSPSFSQNWMHILFPSHKTCILSNPLVNSRTVKPGAHELKHSWSTCDKYRHSACFRFVCLHYYGTIWIHFHQNMCTMFGWNGYCMIQILASSETKCVLIFFNSRLRLVPVIHLCISTWIPLKKKIWRPQLP